MYGKSIVAIDKKKTYKPIFNIKDIFNSGAILRHFWLFLKILISGQKNNNKPKIAIRHYYISVKREKLKEK